MAGQQQKYRWYILALVILTDMLVMAIPLMGLSVLSKEISQSLHLSVVQVGIVWGMSSLPQMITSIVGGVIGDTRGPKQVLVWASLVGGLLSAARGLAFDFVSLTVLVVLHGALVPIIIMNGLKTNSQWFSLRELGIANGLTSVGIAFGFIFGSFFSASILSPLLGGWRNVLYLYGFLGMLLAIPWFFSRAPAPRTQTVLHSGSVWKTVRYVAGLKKVWLFGLAMFGINGAVQGILGYLPLYLRGIGWQPVLADSAVSAFHMVSMVCVMPVILLANRAGWRKRVLMAAGLLIALGSGILSLSNDFLIWPAVLLTGFVRDGFMATMFTSVVETDGVGPAYAGTAIGFTNAVGNLGNVLSPPVGNSFASLYAGAPFGLWSGLALFGVTCLALIRKRAAVVVPSADA